MDTTCRLCAVHSSSLTSVFSFKNTRLIVDVVQAICPIKIDIKDSLPHEICTRCLKTVFEAIELREKSVLNDFNFRSSQPLPHHPEVIKIKEEKDPFNIFLEEASTNHFEDDFSEESDDDFLPMVSYEPQAKKMRKNSSSGSR